jgi:hypothetical protein
MGSARVSVYSGQEKTAAFTDVPFFRRNHRADVWSPSHPYLADYHDDCSPHQ